MQLQSTIVLTTRNVKNAYWDWRYQIDNLTAQQQSLDLAKRLLADNERRVQIGTMAPIDIVEAQSEVARNDESVIVAEAAIKQAEDRLRALIFDPATPDFWTIGIEPTETAPFHAAGDRRRRRGPPRARQPHRRAAGEEQPGAERHQHPLLPQPDPARRQRAVANYSTSRSAASGADDRLGHRPAADVVPTGPVERSILSQRGFGSVLGDVVHQRVPDLDGRRPGRLSRSARARSRPTWRARGCSIRRRRRS